MNHQETSKVGPHSSYLCPTAEQGVPPHSKQSLPTWKIQQRTHPLAGFLSSPSCEVPVLNRGQGVEDGWVGRRVLDE